MNKYIIFSVDNIIQHTDGKAPSGRTDGPTKKTIAQLEDAIKNASEVAVPAYAKATCTLKDYMDQVDVVSSIKINIYGHWNKLFQNVKNILYECLMKLVN